MIVPDGSTGLWMYFVCVEWCCPSQIYVPNIEDLVDHKSNHDNKDNYN